MTFKNNYKAVFLGCPVDAFTMTEAVDLVDQTIKGAGSISYSDVDAAKLAQMWINPSLHKYVLDTDYIGADGMSLVWISKFSKTPLPERVTGIDLMLNLFSLAREKKYKIYFLGASEEVLNDVLDKFTHECSPELIAGSRKGFFDVDKEGEEIAKDISNSGAQMLFIAMNTPKKEYFIYKYKDIIKSVNFRMGVGGSFDFYSGSVKRAPLWMQRLCLEWFYRWMQEPVRQWRNEVVDNFYFLYFMATNKLRKIMDRS